MTKFVIEYVGLIEIEAETEELAYLQFQNTDNIEIGKYVHSYEILDPEEYPELYENKQMRVK